jgi:hypothetical protein
VTRDTLLRNLRTALPQFEVNPDWSADNLTYPIINDLARYICEQASYGEHEEIKQALQFLELCLTEGDSDVRDLVHECLDTINSCVHIEQIKVHFGTQVFELWKTFSKSS